MFHKQYINFPAVCRNSNSKKRTPDKLSLVSRSQPDLFSSVEEDDNAEVAAATATAAAGGAADAAARYAAEKLAANQIKVRCQLSSTANPTILG